MVRPAGALDLLRAHVPVRRPRAVVIGVRAAAGATLIPDLVTIRVMPALVALAALAGSSPACAQDTFAPSRVDGDAGSATAIDGWQIQSSAKAPQSGAEVSAVGFSTQGW